MIERNYAQDICLPEISNLKDANECVASFFVSLRLALDNARVMTYDSRNPTYAVIQAAEDSIRRELWRLMP